MPRYARPKHRYVTIDGTLYRLSEANYRRCLRDVVKSDADLYRPDPKHFRMLAASDQPVVDWSRLSADVARTLLAADAPTVPADNDNDSGYGDPNPEAAAVRRDLATA